MIIDDISCEINGNDPVVVILPMAVVLSVASVDGVKQHAYESIPGPATAQRWPL